jgi:hypothetical protein
MPGMIDAHVHINTGGETEAQRTLIALSKLFGCRITASTKAPATPRHEDPAAASLP